MMDLLTHSRVLMHPYVLGELALGNFRNRGQALSALGDLPKAVIADVAEVLHFIDVNNLAGSGIGYVGAHLLASCRLTNDAVLWTRDKRLMAAAGHMGVLARL